MGGKSGESAGKKGRRPLKKARGYYRKLKNDLPSIENMQAKLSSAELQGEMDKISLQEREDIRVDPQFKEAQMDALAELKEQGKGLTPAQRAERNQMLREGAAQSQAQRQAIDQQMAQKGMSSSGASLLSKLQANEDANARAAASGEALLTRTDNSKRDALSRAANMASAIGQQDYTRDSANQARRMDIEKFNKQNQQNTQQQNLTARQNIENARANVANQQAIQNAGAYQQDFANKSAIASGMAGVRAQEAGTYSSTPKSTSGIGKVVGGVAGAYFGGPAGASVGAGAGDALESSMMEDGGITQRFADPYQVVQPQVGTAIPANPSQYDREKDLSPIENMLFKKDAFEEPVAKEQILGVGNDKTSAEVNDYAKAKEITGEVDKGMSMDDKLGYAKLATSLLKPKEQPVQTKKEYKVDPLQVQNTMGNFKYTPFEDGGLSGEEIVEIQKAKVRAQLGGGDSGADRVEQMKAEIRRQIAERNALKNPTPEYEDGGTYQYADGSLDFLSDGNGDIVEGDSFERDRVDAKLNSGEMVLNAAQQQRMMDMIRGEISPDEVGTEDIVEGVPSEYQEDLKKGNKDSMGKGFKKLLKMLGE